MRAVVLIVLLGMWTISVCDDPVVVNEAAVQVNKTAEEPHVVTVADPKVVTVADPKVVTVDVPNQQTVAVDKTVEAEHAVAAEKTVTVPEPGYASSHHQFQPCPVPEYLNWGSLKRMLWNLDGLDLVLSYMIWCGVFMSLVYIGKIFEVLGLFYQDDEENSEISVTMPQIIYFDAKGRIM